MPMLWRTCRRSPNSRRRRPTPRRLPAAAPRWSNQRRASRPESLRMPWIASTPIGSKPPSLAFSPCIAPASRVSCTMRSRSAPCHQAPRSGERTPRLVVGIHDAVRNGQCRAHEAACAATSRAARTFSLVWLKSRSRRAFSSSSASLRSPRSLPMRRPLSTAGRSPTW